MAPRAEQCSDLAIVDRMIVQITDRFEEQDANTNGESPLLVELPFLCILENPVR